MQDQNLETLSQDELPQNKQVDRETEIMSIREKLAKIRLAGDSEVVSNLSNPKIPLVKTFESDLANGVSDGSFSKLNIISGEMDNGVSALSVADKSKKLKKILFITFGVLFLVASSVGGYYYYQYINKPVPIVVEVKRYFIGDVWKSVSKDSVLKAATSDATSTDDIIIINLQSFERAYPYLLKNENKFEGIATDNFKYTNLGDFQDATIENIDMRVADCNEGAIIYGYVGKNKLVIANDIGKYIKTYKSLKK